MVNNMYCGGGPPGLVVCPLCNQPWGAHLKQCKYATPKKSPRG